MGTNPVREQAKIRKPYTITKQREKWTDEEHKRFLEALRLHGRTWQRIQEHIGTKSAVQIRSHAQKFFLKLEKGNEGMPNGHSHDIEIPPPRPKRKPYSSYPRKTGSASQVPPDEIREKNLSKSFVLLSTDKVILDTAIKKFGEGSPSTSAYFHNGDVSECSQEHIPVREELKEKRITLTKKLNKDDEEMQYFGMDGDFSVSRFGFTSSKDSLENVKSHEKVTAQIESTKYYGEGIFAQLQANADLNLSLDSTNLAKHWPKKSTAVSSIQHALPSFSLINQLHNDDNAFNALINLTNYFPSLLASALSQNPAIHQAASIAAALLPPTYVDFSMHSNTKLAGEAPEQQSSASCMSAIVTATVAAAAAWWRVHGLLPSHLLADHVLLQKEVPHVQDYDNSNSKENVNQNHKPKSATHTKPCSALLEPSSSPDNCASQAPGKKNHDPSSSDSNTSPNCEEKDATMNEKEAKRIIGQSERAPYVNQESRAVRDSKSCSKGLEQTPLTFQPLFSEELLSSSFLPLQLNANLAFNTGKEEAFGLQIDLNRRLFTATTSNRSKEMALNGPVAAAYKQHLVETERTDTDQEESSAKRACL